jgi:hypothetical protein
MYRRWEYDIKTGLQNIFMCYLIDLFQLRTLYIPELDVKIMSCKKLIVFNGSCLFNCKDKKVTKTIMHYFLCPPIILNRNQPNKILEH